MDALRRIMRALRRSGRLAESRLGISAAQLFVLHEVAATGEASINELAARTLTHQSSVSLVVTRLERAGLVVRRRHGRDRRRTRVVLTPAGRRRLARAPEVLQVRLLASLARLTPPERSTLARALEKLVDAVEKTHAVPPMFLE
jgi:DNA-binding MarR family transcriptional regulator